MKLGRHFQDNKQMLQRQADLFYLSCNALPSDVASPTQA